VRELRWLVPEQGRRLGRMVCVARRDGCGYSFAIKIVSPRLLLELLRAPEDVVVVRELNLIAIYAALSKVRRGRTIVALVEGDYGFLGRTGTARPKVALRRVATRGVDVLLANSDAAYRYLTGTLGVAEDKIVVGWWLAGMPPDLEPVTPPGLPPPGEGPTFACIGQLIPRKGLDLLVTALAGYSRRHGPCRLVIAGDGPERPALIALAQELGVADRVTFAGALSHAEVKGLLQSCDALVFPTQKDLVGRIAVEALSLGVPVVVSPMAGAACTIVDDGVNGVVADPRDPVAFADALGRFAGAGERERLRRGAEKSAVPLTPEAGAAHVLVAVAQARACARPVRLAGGRALP
jgi:glycosyltransferase involved in cell wall biosynthesis